MLWGAGAKGIVVVDYRGITVDAVTSMRNDLRKENTIDNLLILGNRKELKIIGMPASPVIDGQLIIDNGVNILKRKEHHQIPFNHPPKNLSPKVL